MQDELASLRQRIDQIDDEIVRLLNARLAVVERVASVKRGLGLAIVARSREQQVLDRLLSNNGGPLPAGALETIYRAVIATCRELQLDLDRRRGGGTARGPITTEGPRPRR